MIEHDLVGKLKKYLLGSPAMNSHSFSAQHLIVGRLGIPWGFRTLLFCSVILMD